MKTTGWADDICKKEVWAKDLRIYGPSTQSLLSQLGVRNGCQVNSGVWTWISDHGLFVAIGKKGSRLAWLCLQTGLYTSKSSMQGCEGDLTATSVTPLIARVDLADLAG